MLRFDTDGRFAWSPAGPYRTVHGRYLLAGGTLTVAVAGTSLCPPGDAYAWRATVTRTGRLHLTPPTGMLPDGCLRASATWSGRRLGAGSGE